MVHDTLQDILPFVEQPSRYLGTEINRIRKDHRHVKLKMVLAFPDLYEIGTSHFGLQILYSILNQRKDVAAERVYAPGVDLESHLRAAGTPLVSMESRRPLNGFDIMGFSLLYELNYTNILNMLELSGIPFLANRRDVSHPLIIAGGPCACNPEPVADLFDAIVIGDGETVILDMVDGWLEWHDHHHNDRDALLKIWSKIEGVYIPSYFEPVSNPSGRQTAVPRYPEYAKVVRAVVSDLDHASFPEAPLVPYGRPVHDRLRLEVSRGCTRGCRFCQAGMIYRPVRERSPETLLTQAERAIEKTGYENLSLLSLSTGDYTDLVPFLDRLMIRCRPHQIAVSLPSLRAETLTPHLMETIKRIRKTGFTIAPEAGSQRMRNVINKNITQEDIFRTVADAFRLGWRVIKLYFMIGLPTETDEDIKALLTLVKDLRKIHRKQGQINVSIAAFIPKPHTPFQWSPQMSLSESTEKIDRIRSHLNVSRIHVKWQNPKMSILEGLWARGDRRLGNLLITAFEKGCRFDGWSDQFHFERWTAALSDTGIDMDDYTTRPRSPSEPLPWDHIDTRVSKAFLKAEWEKAIRGEPTSDCRYGDCCACGVCDFVDVKPQIFNILKDRIETGTGGPDSRDTVFRRLQIDYEKMGQARYFGHLEMKNIFFRAIRRSGMTVKYTEGFHPMPKASFDDPLPVGMESEKETFVLTIDQTTVPEDVKRRLNMNLPDGLTVRSCRFVDGKSPRLKGSEISYRITLKNSPFDPAMIERFNGRSAWVVDRKSKKGKTNAIDLKKAIRRIALQPGGDLELSIQSEPGKMVRPAEVLRHLFDLSEQVVKGTRMLKLAG